jgi:hypothetical protein
MSCKLEDSLPLVTNEGQVGRWGPRHFVTPRPETEGPRMVWPLQGLFLPAGLTQRIRLATLQRICFSCFYTLSVALTNKDAINLSINLHKCCIPPRLFAAKGGRGFLPRPRKPRGFSASGEEVGSCKLKNSLPLVTNEGQVG